MFSNHTNSSSSSSSTSIRVTLSSGKSTTEKPTTELEKKDNQDPGNAFLLAPLAHMIIDYAGIPGLATQGLGKISLYGVNDMLQVRVLLDYVVKGNLAEVKKIIEKNPNLLLQQGWAVDYSGRKIYGTALQMALGAEDIGIQKNEECMVEVIQEHLRKFLESDADAEIAKQTLKQFPEGWEKQEEKRATQDLLALNKVFKAIDEAKPADNSYKACEEACEPALITFRAYLESQAKTTIRNGKHFNVQLLAEAFKLYDENYTAFGNNWDSPKNILSWRKVCGFIQRFLPTCYAQAFCQGIYNITGHKEKLTRSLEFRHDKGYFFFPLADSHSGLGYDYACITTPGRERAADSTVCWVSTFTNLMSNKNSKLAELIQPAKPQPKSQGVIS